MKGRMFLLGSINMYGPRHSQMNITYLLKNIYIVKVLK